jgi:acetyl-CoA synthetase
MDYLSKLSEEELFEIGLIRQNGKIEINIPPETNIYKMTLGNYLNDHNINNHAIIFENQYGQIQNFTFGQVEEMAHGLASKLASLGYRFGSNIAIHTGQHPDTAIAHMAICKIGGVAVTLSQLYGPETLKHAMNDCKVEVLITSNKAWEKLRKTKSIEFPYLKHVILRDPAKDNKEISLIDAYSYKSHFKPSYGLANDPALLMYTSGSTGKPKGILHGHRVLASYKPSINLFFNLSMKKENAVYWSPSDWAWVGGLLDMLFPAWMAGKAIATSEDRFNAEWAYNFIERHKVTHTFLAPTAIKRLAQLENPRDKYDLSLEVICTGGEALASETLEWAENKLGVVCNEFYGMTEVNHLVGNCKALYPRKPGSMGRIYPGHKVLLINDELSEVDINNTGEIVTTLTSPTRFLGYLNNKAKENDMKIGGYLRTHDLASKDSDGYFWYKGRSDDLIKSSGFRIGPAEIEDSLLSHEAITEAAAIGKPDQDRGSIVKAFVKLHKKYKPTKELKEEIRNFVKENLAAYKAPREIEFVDDFIMTSSGKINRRVLREIENKKIKN